jgi:hypothetical protein
VCPPWIHEIQTEYEVWVDGRSFNCSTCYGERSKMGCTASLKARLIPDPRGRPSGLGHLGSAHKEQLGPLMHTVDVKMVKWLSTHHFLTGVFEMG